jgi:hypothetical protein
MARSNKPDSAKILDQALELPGEIAPYYSYFHQYSLTNMIELYVQGAREIVGTRKQWASVGHEIKPGAQRYSIWVPIIIRRKDDEGQLQEIFTGRYNWVPCIYTLSQTTGEPITPKETPGWSLPQMLARMAIRQTAFESQFGGLQGYSHGTEMAVSPIAADPFGTAIHEAAHILLGHTLEHGLDGESYHRGVQEFQAEAVRYLVKNELGMLDEDSARYSRGYMHHYLQDEKPPEQACRQVLTVAGRILEAGRVAIEAESAH